jgi:hypothetical protein
MLITAASFPTTAASFPTAAQAFFTAAESIFFGSQALTSESRKKRLQLPCNLKETGASNLASPSWS